MDDQSEKLPVLTREAVRQLDRTAIEQLGMPGAVLMENAGRGAAEVMARLGELRRVVVVCGKGNNAGDGFVIARHLDLMGCDVEIRLCSGAETLQGDARLNYDLLSHTRVKMCSGADFHSLDSLEREDWVVDALLGTGATGEPRPPFGPAIEAMNACRARRMAIDISSGLDADSGHASDTTFRADHTCTFVAAKPGMLKASGRPYVGQLHIVGIGAPSRLLTQFGIGSPS